MIPGHLPNLSTNSITTDTNGRAMTKVINILTKLSVLVEWYENWMIGGMRIQNEAMNMELERIK